MKTFLYIGACVLAFMMPFFPADTQPIASSGTLDSISSFRNAPLIPMEMSAAEESFYADFPGATGYFTVDGRPGESVFLRHTEKPTRLLHSAEGCYRASGYELEYIDNIMLTVDEFTDRELIWSQFRIVDGGRSFLIRQCIVSLSTDRQYADVPAWYWQTMFSSGDPGPWLAVTWKLPE
jgi:hypothetical protein